MIDFFIEWEIVFVIINENIGMIVDEIYCYWFDIFVVIIWFFNYE